MISYGQSVSLHGQSNRTEHAHIDFAATGARAARAKVLQSQTPQQGLGHRKARGSCVHQGVGHIDHTSCVRCQCPPARPRTNPAVLRRAATITLPMFVSPKELLTNPAGHRAFQSPNQPGGRPDPSSIGIVLLFIAVHIGKRLNAATADQAFSPISSSWSSLTYFPSSTHFACVLSVANLGCHSPSASCRYSTSARASRPACRRLSARSHST